MVVNDDLKAKGGACNNTIINLINNIIQRTIILCVSIDEAKVSIHIRGTFFSYNVYALVRMMINLV